MADEIGRERQTILVAEDEDGVRTLVSRGLAKDYDVLVAADGMEALEISRSFPGTIDVLLSDIQMPRMPGTELAHQLRKDRPDLKVVLMSGSTGGMLVLDQGWEFIEKPFIPTALHRKIAEVLHKSRTAAL